MKISVFRSDDTLKLTFTQDGLDAIPPLREVWFAGRLLKPLSSERICVLGYLLAAPFVGNKIEFDGVACPAHIAARMATMVEGREFFIGPVDNQAKKILFESRHSALSLVPGERANDLRLHRHPLGYEIISAHNPDTATLIRSNVDLFAGLAESSAALPLLTLFAATAEAAGVRRAICSDLEPEMIVHLRPLFADAGLELREWS